MSAEPEDRSLPQLEADWQIKQKEFERLEAQYVILVDRMPPARQIVRGTPIEVLDEIERRKEAADGAWQVWFAALRRSHSPPEY